MTGCNPGLVSHFVRAALDDIAASALREVPVGLLSSQLRRLLEDGDYPRIGKMLGLKVVHISEIDTQVSSRYVVLQQFLNNVACSVLTCIVSEKSILRSS
jgi:homospermidine synthase